MKQPNRRTKLLLCSLLTVSAMSTGCDPINWFGPNLFVSLNIPLGLGGAPGLLNPFGIVQALINSAVGASADAGDSATFPSPTSTAPGIGELTGNNPTPAPPQPPTTFLP